MKKYIFILLIVFTSCFSQNSSDKEIYLSILKEPINSYYIISKQSEGYEILEKIVTRKNIHNNHTPEKNIVLTNKELSYIKTEINKNKDYIFLENMLAKVKLISKDTLQSYSLNKTEKWRKEFDSAIKSKDSTLIQKFKNERPYPHIETFVDFFSKPIYFRNSSLCIIYHANLCNFHQGLGGCQSVYIYKKENENWSKFIEITVGCY